MEKLQVAIERARQKREGKGGGSAPTSRRSGAQPESQRKRPGPRLLPDDLMDRWMALAECPLPRSSGDARRLVAHLPGPEASHFDILRTKVLIEVRKNGWRRIAITSPTGGCGKSTTACNLALAISRQGELRTALFDLDLRRPAVSRILGTKPAYDINEMLEGTVEFEEQAMRVGNNLAVSMATQSQTDPSAILSSEKTSAMIEEIERVYAPDVMIFDLPPLLVVDDARAFLRNVDAAILLANAEVSTAQQIDICEREIADQTNVLGVVLNKCRFPEQSQRGDYGYA